MTHRCFGFISNLPAKAFARDEDRFAGHFRRTDQAVTRRIESEKAAGPRCPPTAVLGVIADRAGSVFAEFDRQPLSDRGHTGQGQQTCEEWPDIGLIPAVIHRILLGPVKADFLLSPVILRWFYRCCRHQAHLPRRRWRRVRPVLRERLQRLALALAQQPCEAVEIVAQALLSIVVCVTE